MRYIILILCGCAVFLTNAQNTITTQGNQYFAQIEIDNSNTAVVDSVVNSIKTNPNVFIVRYDEITNGLLFITNALTTFNESTMISWFEGNDNIINCFRIGIQGVDQHIAFGTNFCNQSN